MLCKYSVRLHNKQQSILYSLSNLKSVKQMQRFILNFSWGTGDQIRDVRDYLRGKGEEMGKTWSLFVFLSKHKEWRRQFYFKRSILCQVKTVSFFHIRKDSQLHKHLLWLTVELNNYSILIRTLNIERFKTNGTFSSFSLYLPQDS